MIRVIRGQQVMLDSDLAMLYGVKTSALNQAVKRNIGRFPDDFMFQLTKSELGLLKSQIAISKSAENQHDKVLISQIVTSKPIERRGGTQTPPFAFTRNGIGSGIVVLNASGCRRGAPAVVDALKRTTAGKCVITYEADGLREISDDRRADIRLDTDIRRMPISERSIIIVVLYFSNMQKGPVS